MSSKYVVLAGATTIAAACSVPYFKSWTLQMTSRVFYTCQRAWFGYSRLPKDLKGWDHRDFDNLDMVNEDEDESEKRWKSLDKFFRWNGYTLYGFSPTRGSEWQIPPEPCTTIRPKPEYPYSRNYFENENHAAMFCATMFVRAARDRKGREVVIKLVADDKTTYEFDILNFLNSKKARSDPRNHVIPVVDYIHLEKFTFAVMPRWGQAFGPEFTTVHEVMDMVHQFLQGLDFLHENKILHWDFFEQNLAMDSLFPKFIPASIKGLRDPHSSRYAMIDFGESKMYPPCMDIKDIRETFKSKPYHFKWRNVPVPESPFCPFPVDVCGAGRLLERWSRHIANYVPELGPFYDSMTDADIGKRLSAAEASRRFDDIYARLSKDQLSQQITTWMYANGISKPKGGVTEVDARTFFPVPETWRTSDLPNFESENHRMQVISQSDEHSPRKHDSKGPYRRNF